MYIFCLAPYMKEFIINAEHALLPVDTPKVV